MNQIYENGFPLNEKYSNKSVSIVNKDLSEIVAFEKETLALCDVLQNLIKEYKIMSYFWGRQMFTLEGLLGTRSDYKTLQIHLMYANANVR
jgi:hypothetical protein